MLSSSSLNINRYDNLSTRHALEIDVPNFRWCLGPNCTFGQEHPDSPTEQPISVCSACGFVSCAQHNVPWHSGENCEEYDKRVKAGEDFGDKKSRKTIRRIAKRCPGCQRYINKNGGCQHMSCKLIPIVNFGTVREEHEKRAGLTMLGRFMWEAVLLALFARLSASLLGVCSKTLRCCCEVTFQLAVWSEIHCCLIRGVSRMCKLLVV